MLCLSLSFGSLWRTRNQAHRLTQQRVQGVDVMRLLSLEYWEPQDYVFVYIGNGLSSNEKVRITDFSGSWGLWKLCMSLQAVMSGEARSHDLGGITWTKLEPHADYLHSPTLGSKLSYIQFNKISAEPMGQTLYQVLWYSYEYDPLNRAATEFTA